MSYSRWLIVVPLLLLSVADQSHGQQPRVSVIPAGGIYLPISDLGAAGGYRIRASPGLVAGLIIDVPTSPAWGMRLAATRTFGVAVRIAEETSGDVAIRTRHSINWMAVGIRWTANLRRTGLRISPGVYAGFRLDWERDLRTSCLGQPYCPADDALYETQLDPELSISVPAELDVGPVAVALRPRMSVGPFGIGDEEGDWRAEGFLTASLVIPLGTRPH